MSDLNLPRFQGNIIRKDEAPEIVTTRNFDNLSSVLSDAFDLLEANDTDFEARLKHLQFAVLRLTSIIQNILGVTDNYDPAFAYQINDPTISGGLMYSSLDEGDNIGNTPLSSPSHWQRITLIDYLRTKVFTKTP
jgi:hypothetical protein